MKIMDAMYNIRTNRSFSSLPTGHFNVVVFWGVFFCLFFCRLYFFSKSTFLIKSFRNTTNVVNSYIRIKGQPQTIEPVLSANCLQSLSADDTCTHRVKGFAHFKLLQWV